MSNNNLLRSIANIREIRISKAKRMMHEVLVEYNNAKSEQVRSEKVLEHLKVEYPEKINLIKENFDQSEKNVSALEVYRNERKEIREKVVIAASNLEKNTEQVIHLASNLETKEALLKLRIKQFEKINHIINNFNF